MDNIGPCRHKQPLAAMSQPRLQSPPSVDASRFALQHGLFSQHLENDLRDRRIGGPLFEAPPAAVVQELGIFYRPLSCRMVGMDGLVRGWKCAKN